MSDPISDMLTRIRNAGRALLPAVELPHSRMKESVAKILKRKATSPTWPWRASKIKKIKIQPEIPGQEERD